MIDFKKTGVSTLFPSCVFQGEIVDNKDIEDYPNIIKTLRDTDTNLENFDQFGNYHSSDMLHEDPRFADIAELAYIQTQEILDFLCVARDDHYITNMWANISKPAHRHMLHIHPNCYLSGILYIQTPEQCGSTVFYDPRSNARMFEPDFLAENLYNTGTAIIKPEVGKMLIFPSWLPHGVEAGFCEPDEERISIAFNVMIKGQIHNKTAKLDLK